MANENPIGVFDSGIGGITVFNAIRNELPRENLIYFGDSIHLPYGEKSMETIRQLSAGVTDFLLRQQCKMLVIACNTASAAALKFLREQHPQLPIIGMEPAVKPAAEQTQSGVVGVLATTATFQGELFASVVERFAKDVHVLRQPCPGLVQQIEAGKTNDPETETMLRAWVEPMLEKGIDALVLGCTHYPFIRPLLQKIVGDGVRLIDPAPAVARQTRKILEQKNILHTTTATGKLRYFTTEPVNDFAETLFVLTGEQRNVELAVWESDFFVRENL